MCTLDAVGGGGVYQYDDEQRELTLLKSVGLPAGFVRKVARYGDDRPEMKLVRAGQVLYVSDSGDTPASAVLRPWKIRMVAVLPLLRYGRLYGALNVATFKDQPFSANTRLALETLAGYASQIMASLEQGRALRESEERYRAMCYGAVEGILVFRPDGVCTYANQAARQGLGAPAEGAEVNLPEAWRERVRQVVASGQPIAQEEKLPLKRGWRVVESSWVPIRPGPARVSAVSCVYRDVTERLRLATERQLLAKRLLVVQEQERKSVSSFLHNHMGPILITAKIELEQLAREVAQRHRPLVQRVLGQLDEAVSGIRHKAVAVRPPLLDDLGVKDALEFLVEEFERQHGIAIQLAPIPRLPNLNPAIKTCLYRLLEEALSNVVTHARATTTKVSVKRRRHELVMHIRDNGVGYDAGSVQPGDALGLVGMREIVDSLGGSLTLQSRVGRGTFVEVVVPVENEK